MPVRTRFDRRAANLRAMLAEHGLEALLVADRASVRYLTGFTGSEGAVLVTRRALYLIVDFRYFEQAGREAPEAELVHVEGALYDRAIAEAAREAGLSRLAFEADHTTYAQFLGLAGALASVELVPSRGLVERGREVKDAGELESIRRAAAITRAAIAAAAATLKAGQTEREVANEIERQAHRLGGEGMAFTTLVAFGERTALPHPTPGDRALAAGDWVLLDAGAVYEGYCADMTRSFVYGPMVERQREVLEAVQAALSAGLAAIRPGVSARAVDAAARRALAPYGLAELFGHPTGHGVGLSVHEGPRLAPDGDEALEAGMVITVEPGVYVPGWGGCRLEELVLVGRRGPEVLTATPDGAASLGTLGQLLL